MDLAGQTAIVTGGASGLGAATAALLAARGANVWIADRDAQDPVDVTSADDWAALTKRVIDATGRLDILVNGAGVTGGGPDADIASVSIDAWRKVFAVNIEGVLLGCQAALRVMRTGAIVNIASTAGISPSPALGAYGASKASVIQITRSVAAWCAMKTLPIRCNAVVPGMAETPMTAGFDPAYQAQWQHQIPLGRFASPPEIAEAIAFLASPAASYITGAALPVDGGLLSRPVVK